MFKWSVHNIRPSDVILLYTVLMVSDEESCLDGASCEHGFTCTDGSCIAYKLPE